SPEFSEFLHSTGYKIDSKTYKLFSFALKFKKSEFRNGCINIIDPEAYLYIASPKIEEFIKNFILGTFEARELRIESTVFNIRFAEMEPLPDISSRMKFVLLSPLVLSTGRIENSKLRQVFLRPQNISTINKVMTSNLRNKYFLLHGNGKDFEEVKLKWDEEYLIKKGTVTKKVSIISENKPPVHNIGIQAPFEIEADPELLSVGYHCGFGEKNSMGFGMAQAVQ